MFIHFGKHYRKRLPKKCSFTGWKVRKLKIVFLSSAARVLAGWLADRDL